MSWHWPAFVDFLLGRLHTQCDVWTHDLEIRGMMLYLISHGGTPAFIDFDWSSLCFLDLDVCFFCQIMEVFQLLFPQISFLPLSLSSSWDSYYMNVMFDGVIEFPTCILMFHNSSFFISASIFSIICLLYHLFISLLLLADY